MNRGVSIVNVASSGDLISSEQLAAYVALNHAVMGLTQALAEGGYLCP